MRKYLYSVLAGAALFGAVGATSAQAGVSVSIGLPFPVIAAPVYYPAPVYYAPPAYYPVYAPRVVYREPVYYAPRPVYRHHHHGHRGHRSQWR